MNFKRNTTNEENNPTLKREISRSGDNTYYKNNFKKIPKSYIEYFFQKERTSKVYFLS